MMDVALLLSPAYSCFIFGFFSFFEISGSLVGLEIKVIEYNDAYIYTPTSDTYNVGLS